MSRRTHRRDEGSTLIMVLVMMVIASLVVLPVMNYSITVFRAQNVQIDKARSIEMARGGTWIALENEASLYDDCGTGPMGSSLAGVSVSCDVLEESTLRHPEEVPFSIATLQADIGDGTNAQVPASMTPGMTTDQLYVNPNRVDLDPTGWDDWLDTPDWTPLSELGSVWLPQLPVQSTSNGGTRDTPMLPGAQDPLYSSCRVFFPGTFTDPITISEPTYFASGVYYFTEPITLQRGADVVVGNGAGIGCTTDFEAIAGVPNPPDPLNMSGLGGTFVLGDNARVIVDDSVGSGDIRLVMNQRYVSDEEASVSASSSVSIVSVNGTHEPLVGTEVLGDDLMIDGVLAVPASTVDDPTDEPDDPSDDPLAATADYLPSIHTPKPIPPDAPTNVDWDGYQYGGNTSSNDDRGHMTVTWDAPNDNGSLITSYVATAHPSGQTCSPTPSPDDNVDGDPDLPLQTSCTIDGISDDSNPSCCVQHSVTVRATNAGGDSPDSAASHSNRVDLRGSFPSSQVPVLTVPDEPENVDIGDSYSDGLEVTWDAPGDDGGTPITSYTVTATPATLPVPPLPLPPLPPSVGVEVTCTSWWDETGCVLPISDPLSVGPYDITVVATNMIGDSTPAEYDSPDELVPSDPNLIEPDPHTFAAGTSPAPTRTPLAATIRVPDPIVDFTMGSSATGTIKIAGYVGIPQGHLAIDTALPANKTVEMLGGMVAAQIHLGAEPSNFEVVFANPIAQKRIRLRSTATSGGYTAVSDAVVKVNRSGSLAINSWFVQ